MSLSTADDIPALLVAGSGPDVRGWLFAVPRGGRAPNVLEELDSLNTSGLITINDRIYRILSSASEQDARGELLVYDSTGVVAYHRIDGLADAHGVISDGTHLVVPCSFTNEIFWITLDGKTASVWRAPGEGDAWHINGLYDRDGILYASAFGMHATHRGWAKTMDQRTGIIFDVRTQRPVVSGLQCPHDPNFIDGGWLVCDSFTRRVLLIDEISGKIKREVLLDGWTRGIAVSATEIFIGVSGARHSSDSKQFARIVVLDRSTWAIVQEIRLPCMEITTLAIVPNSMLAGMRTGFRTNNLRVAVEDRRDLLELAGQGQTTKELPTTPMAPLEHLKDGRVRIRVKAPKRIRPGEYFSVDIAIKNRGRRTLLSAAPFPVHIAVVFTRIASHTENASPEVRRIALPEPLEPNATHRFTLSVQAPATPGPYRVRFTLVQEWVRWFDDDRRWMAKVRSANRRIVRLNCGN